MALLSALIHTDSAGNEKGYPVVFRHKFQEKRSKTAVAAKAIYYSALDSYQVDNGNDER